MSKVKFETNLSELDKIVKILESETLEIDKAIELFKKGKEIIQELNSDLKEIDEKVAKIVVENEK